MYDQNALTAAHLTLPLGTMVRVTNLTTNQSAVVRITDRGPFVHGRIIDLSLAAAKATGLYRMGVAKVKVEAYAPPARQNATPGGRWCVQIGAFAKEKDAVDLKAHLMRRYTTAKVIEFAKTQKELVKFILTMLIFGPKNARVLLAARPEQWRYALPSPPNACRPACART